MRDTAVRDGEGGLDRRLAGKLAGSIEGQFSTRLEDRICYSFDATDMRTLPDAVVWPVSTSDVAAVVLAASDAGVPVVPRGAGTGLTAGSVPVAGGIVVSFERMNRVLSIDRSSRVAVVEAGVINGDLRAEVETLGLFYPPDPASLLVSTIGGNVAEGAGGPRTVLYGTTRDYVVGLEFVLPDGSVAASGLLAHDGGGWDAGPLLVGSEGTLAVVTKIALRLSYRPEAVETYWAEFPSLEDAARAVAAITAAGVPVSVLEILDRETLACALEYVKGEAPETTPSGALLIEVEGAREAVAGAAERLGELLAGHGATEVRRAEGDDERDEIWRVRRSISPSLARLSTGKINEDIAVPRSAIPAFIHEMHGIAAAAKLPILAFGHAGDGNLHVNVIVDRAVPSEMARARDAVHRLFATALAMGGTLSGEHGIGLTKAEHLSEELDAPALETTSSVKRAFDPLGLLNPDKILTSRPNPWWGDLPTDSASA